VTSEVFLLWALYKLLVG